MGATRNLPSSPLSMQYVRVTTFGSGSNDALSRCLWIMAITIFHPVTAPVVTTGVMSFIRSNPYQLPVT